MHQQHLKDHGRDSMNSASKRSGGGMWRKAGSAAAAGEADGKPKRKNRKKASCMIRSHSFHSKIKELVLSLQKSPSAVEAARCSIQAHDDARASQSAGRSSSQSEVDSKRQEVSQVYREASNIRGQFSTAGHAPAPESIRNRITRRPEREPTNRGHDCVAAREPTNTRMGAKTFANNQAALNVQLAMAASRAAQDAAAAHVKNTFVLKNGQEAVLPTMADGMTVMHIGEGHLMHEAGLDVSKRSSDAKSHVRWSAAGSSGSSGIAIDINPERASHDKPNAPFGLAPVASVETEIESVSDRTSVEDVTVGVAKSPQMLTLSQVRDGSRRAGPVRKAGGDVHFVI